MEASETMFSGFTDRTFEYYMAIRMNNNRAFFEANRGWYEGDVKRPMLELIEALAPTALEIDDQLDARPARCLARPMRDVRRLHGQPAYRDYSFFKFRRLGEDRYTTLGLFFDLSDDGASYGCGIYEKNVPMMNALRHAIMTEPERVLKLTERAERAFTLFPNTVKRMAVPESVPDALKRWYSMRGFYMQREIQDFALIKSPALVDEIVRGYGELKGLYQFIQALTPIDDRS